MIDRKSWEAGRDAAADATERGALDRIVRMLPPPAGPPTVVLTIGESEYYAEYLRDAHPEIAAELRARIEEATHGR